MPVIPKFRNGKQEDWEFKVVLNCPDSLGCWRPCFKNKQTKICKAHFLEARRHKCPLKVNKTCVSRGWGFQAGTCEVGLHVARS